MDKISRVRISAVIALAIFGAVPVFAQTSAQRQPFRKAEWSRVKMDSSYDSPQGEAPKASKAANVINNHKATSPSLLMPIGKFEKEIKSDQLGGFVTGVMLDFATQRLSRSPKAPQINADVAIVKFKDECSCIPAGDVSSFDIISLFPIDNNAIILELKGKYLKEFIRNSSQAGAVSSPVEEPLEDNRIYKVVTIDFLLKQEIGGDVMEQAESMKNCNMPLGNTLVQHIKKLSKNGGIIRL